MPKCSLQHNIYYSKYRVFQKSLCKGLGILLGPWSSNPQNFFENVPDMLELSFFQVSCISIGQTKVAQRGCDPGTARGRKPRKMNVHSKK